jgi:hypothetical protein
MRTCGMELVSLLCSGRADPDVLAYDPATQMRRHAWVRPKEAETSLSHSLGDVAAWYGALGVGLLSQSEREAQQPMADDLKSPLVPVWLLHGGDHFTTLFSCDPPAAVSDAAASEAATAPAATYPLVDGSAVGSAKLWHWNGLPPAGPRMALLALAPPHDDDDDAYGKGNGRALGVAKPAPETMASPYRKPKRGEVSALAT